MIYEVCGRNQAEAMKLIDCRLSVGFVVFENKTRKNLCNLIVDTFAQMLSVTDKHRIVKNKHRFDLEAMFVEKLHRFRFDAPEGSTKRLHVFCLRFPFWTVADGKLLKQVLEDVCVCVCVFSFSVPTFVCVSASTSQGVPIHSIVWKTRIGGETRSKTTRWSSIDAASPGTH